MYTLASEFGIKPWEANLDGEKYPEDISTLLLIHHIRMTAERDAQQRANDAANQNSGQRVMRVS